MGRHRRRGSSSSQGEGSRVSSAYFTSLDQPGAHSVDYAPAEGPFHVSSRSAADQSVFVGLVGLLRVPLHLLLSLVAPVLSFLFFLSRQAVLTLIAALAGLALLAGNVCRLAGFLLGAPTTARAAVPPMAIPATTTQVSLACSGPPCDVTIRPHVEDTSANGERGHDKPPMRHRNHSRSCHGSVDASDSTRSGCGSGSTSSRSRRQVAMNRRRPPPVHRRSASCEDLTAHSSPTLTPGESMYCAESLPHPSQRDHLHHATPAKFVGRRLADLRNLALRRAKPESIHHIHSHANSWCAHQDLGLAEPYGTPQSRHSAETSNLPRGLNIQGHLEPVQSRDANARQSSAGLLFTPHVSAHPAVPTTLGESTSQPPVLVKTGAHASDITKVAAVPLHVLETAASPVYRNVQKVNAAVASRVHPLTGEAAQPTARPSAVESAPEVKQPSSQNFPPSSSSTYRQSPAREVASSGKGARDDDVGRKGGASYEAHVSPQRASVSPDQLAHLSSTPDTITARSTAGGSNGLQSDAAQSLMQVVSTDQGLVPATLVTTAAPMIYKPAPMATRRSEDERRHSTGGKDHVSRRHRFKHKLAHIFHPRRSKSVVDPSGLSSPPEPAGAHRPAETTNNGAQLYQINPHTSYHLVPGDSQNPAVLVDPTDHETGAALGLYRVGHGETTLASPQRQPRPRHGQRTQTWHDQSRHSHSLRRQQRRRERRRRSMGAGSASSSCDTNCSCRDGSSSSGGAGPAGEGSSLTTSVSGLSLRSTIGSRSVASSADMRMMDSHRDTEL